MHHSLCFEAGSFSNTDRLFDIELSGKITYGCSVVDLSGYLKKEPNVLVCTDIDANGFKHQYEHIEKLSFDSAGVDTSKILIRKNTSSGMAWIMLNKEGNNSIVVISGANKTLWAQDIEKNKEFIDQSDIILCQMEIPIETVLYAARYAKSCGKTVILDPTPCPAVFPEELYRYINIIKPNETELEQLVGKRQDYAQATDYVRSKGVKTVIVTLGGDGVFINLKETGARHSPSSPVKVVDTIAAGDSFTAALAVKLAEDASLLQAVLYANTVASIVVTKKVPKRLSLQKVRFPKTFDTITSGTKSLIYKQTSPHGTSLFV